MGRKITGKIFVLVALLKILCGCQVIFAQDMDSQEEETGTPLVLYRLEYDKPMDENSYYNIPPTVKITHSGKRGETIFILQADGRKKEGRLEEEGSFTVLSPEDFQDGRNTLEVWMEEGGKKFRYQQVIFKVDTKAPVMKVQIPNASWNQYEICAEVEAEDFPGGSGIKNIACYVNGEEIKTVSGGNAKFQIKECSSDGREVAIRIVARDYAGNEESWEGGAFIDSCLPTVQIKGVTDYMITNQDVEAVFVASDDNILKIAEIRIVRTDPEGKEVIWRKEMASDGNGRKNGYQKLTDEGKYEMELYTEDMSGLVAKSTAQIIIDKQAPVILGVSEWEGRYIQEFSLDFTKEQWIQDFTSCSYIVTVDGEFAYSGQCFKKEGKHQLKVEAVDQAGNRSEARADFIIDRTPPEIVMDGIEDGKSYEQKVSFYITIGKKTDWITEITVNGKEVILPEKCREYFLELSETGIHEIEVCAMDEAENQAKKSAMIEIFPEETMVQKLLNPVQKALGMEQERFMREESEENNNYAGGIKRVLFILPVMTVGSLLGTYYFRKRKSR